jgi:ABC-type glycerol-3-phosphate transport system permease component
VLLTYTAIALFPVIVIVINSFKSRNAIFRSPLSLPTPRDLRPDRLHHGAGAGRLRDSISRTA